MTTQAGELQNITGEVNAIFPNTAGPSGNPFLRVPYHSQRIQSIRFGTNEYIMINSSSGSGSTSEVITGDNRQLNFSFKQGITSGTYKFPDGAGDHLMGVAYGEIVNLDGKHFLQSFTATEATLELEVSNDGRHYKSKRFEIIVKTNKGVTLNIETDFDLYLAIE